MFGVYRMREFEAYDKKRYFLSGASVGELGSSTQAKEEWFSERHSIVRAQPDFPRSRDSALGSKLKPDFPMWSVWFPGEPFPEIKGFDKGAAKPEVKGGPK